MAARPGWGRRESGVGDDPEIALIDTSGAVLKNWTAPSFPAQTSYEVDGNVYEAIGHLRIGTSDGRVRYEVRVRLRPA